MTQPDDRLMVEGVCEQCGLPFYEEYRPEGTYCSGRCTKIARARKTQENQLEAHGPGSCVHHWIIGEPHQGEQQGDCKFCGEHRVFKPVYTTPWTDETSTIQDRLNTSVGPDSVGRRAV